MFKINYSINMNGKKYSSLYPKNGIADGNIFSLKGKNDNGKTTLLKIIAHAFGAANRDNNTISESLRRDINDIADGSNELKYNLILQYPDSTDTVEIEYTGTVSKYKINGVPMAGSVFFKKFAVLFEIREKMSDKLDRHLNDIKERFYHYLNYIDAYDRDLRDLFDTVSAYENKQNELKQFRDSISELEKQLSIRDQLKKKYEQLLRNARKEYVKYLYETLTMDFRDKEMKLDAIKKRLNQDKKTKQSGSNFDKDLMEQSNSLRDKINDNRPLFKNLRDLQLRNKYDEIVRNLGSLSDPDSITYPYLLSLTDYFKLVKTYISNEFPQDNKSKLEKEKQELDFLKKIIEIIEQYSNRDIELPGSGKKLIELLSPVQERYKDLNSSLSHFDTMFALDNVCIDIISQIGRVTLELGKYEKRPVSSNVAIDNEDIEELTKRYNELDKSRDQISKELTKIEDEWESIPDDEKNNIPITSDVKKDYEDLEKKYNDIKKEIDKLNNDLDSQKQYISHLSETKKPATNMSSEDIKQMIENVEKLKNKFSKYTSMLKDITLSKLEQGVELDKDRSDFLSKIGEYFADVVGSIYREHEKMKVKKIDFQNRLYVMEDGSIIKANTEGSGHSSLNAITARMKNPFPGKKKILLIDEITDMDPGVKDFLIEEVKEQISSGESVLALMTEWGYDSDENELIPIK